VVIGIQSIQAPNFICQPLISFSVPHPSEAKVHLRIQMYGQYFKKPILPFYRRSLTSEITLTDNESSLTALIQALSNLDDLCATVEDAYENGMKKAGYESGGDIESD
jgi:DNA-directed RNA polymerase I and III subunit RPAC2